MLVPVTMDRDPFDLFSLHCRLNAGVHALPKRLKYLQLYKQKGELLDVQQANAPVGAILSLQWSRFGKSFDLRITFGV